MVGKEEREPIDLKEVQNIELNILVAFHNFCQKNGLRYYLAGYDLRCNKLSVGLYRGMLILTLLCYDLII